MKKFIVEAYVKNNPFRIQKIPKKIFFRKEVFRLTMLQFPNRETFDEKQINAILKSMYDDFATLRRYLIDEKFLLRNRDGSEYKINPEMILTTSFIEEQTN